MVDTLRLSASGLGSSTVDQVLKYTKYLRYIPSTSTSQVPFFSKKYLTLGVLRAIQVDSPPSLRAAILVDTIIHNYRLSTPP